ncbi:MAG: hypothetical protein IPL54_04770 [Chitinophagaceae bacterium]|nr:hypothetical protein [Chitinophagaceae bacterium]
MSFCLAYDAVSTVIPGNTSMQQLKENLSAVSKPVSKTLVQQLETFYEEEVEEPAYSLVTVNYGSVLSSRTE